MAKFNPALLVPALQVAEFAKPASGARTAQQTALDNIARMKEQHAAGDGAEGKKNYRVAGNKVAFTVRVSNTALVLERVKVQDTEVDVKEMTVPVANFFEALDYYADRIKAGEYDAQLATLTESRAASREKARSTRASKKTDKPAKA